MEGLLVQIVGGSSAVNGQFFDRGSRDDYDAWAEVGRPEFDGFSDKWDWKGILPFFKKSVTFTPPTKESAEKYGFTWDEQAAYGGNGSIDSSYPPFQWPIQRISRYPALRKSKPTDRVFRCIPRCLGRSRRSSTERV